MWTGCPKTAGPTLEGLASGPLFCVYLCEGTGKTKLIVEHFVITERLRCAAPSSRASTRDTVWFALCKQRMNVCPLSSFCGHCYGCHSPLYSRNMKGTCTTQKVGLYRFGGNKGKAVAYDGENHWEEDILDFSKFVKRALLKDKDVNI